MNLTRHVVNATATQTDFVVLRGPRTLARYAADWLLRRARAVEGKIAICLAGGETPLAAYGLLATPAYRARFPWDRVHWFWGDERFVPHDDPRSNYRAARAALFDRVPVPPENIHPIPTQGGLELAAKEYEATLKQFYGADRLDGARALFVATVLGIGADGHTASLFPGTAALEETQRWVAPVPEAKPEPRITLTFPTIASSGEIAFLASGGGKREIVGRIRSGGDVPATRIRCAGLTHWFVDRAAAGAGPS